MLFFDLWDFWLIMFRPGDDRCPREVREGLMAMVLFS